MAPDSPTPITPKEVQILVGISADGNSLGTAAFCTVLKHMQHEKQLVGAYSNSLATRVTLLGIIAGLQALKGSCIVEVVVQNEIVVNAFEKNWILEWERKGLLKRATTKVKHTDLYAQIYDLMQGHAVTFSQPTIMDEEKLMERCKTVAKQLKRTGPWAADVNRFLADTGAATLELD